MFKEAVWLINLILFSDGCYYTRKLRSAALKLFSFNVIALLNLFETCCLTKSFDYSKYSFVWLHTKFFLGSYQKDFS